MRRLWMVFSGLATGLGASAAQGQTLFSSVDTLDVARYATVEQCLAAIERVKDSVMIQPERIWRDTLPQTPARLSEDARAPLPAPVAAVARRCSARFEAGAAPLVDFAPLLSLFIAADRDADAGTLLERRLKAAGPDAGRERAAVLDTAIHVYLGNNQLAGQSWSLPLFAQPARLAAAESLVTAFVQMKTVSWQQRFDAYGVLAVAGNFSFADFSFADTTLANRAVKGMLAVVNGLSDLERHSSAFQSRAWFINLALMFSRRGALLDSLRHSTAAYVALWRQLWGEVAGRDDAVLSGFARPIGQLAPPVTADWWFGRDDSTVGRPVKGKVNLVVFLNPGDYSCFEIDTALCFRTYAGLRRLAQQFPALEITLVAQTYGFFDKAAPPPPGAEAALLRQAWLTERHLPGALAVTATPFWRLPAPDRRRINRDVPNVTHYSFGRTLSLPNWIFPPFLIDQDGMIVEIYFRSFDADLPEMIAILLARQAAPPQSGRVRE